MRFWCDVRNVDVSEVAQSERSMAGVDSTTTSYYLAAYFGPVHDSQGGANFRVELAERSGQTIHDAIDSIAELLASQGIELRGSW